MIRRPSAQLGFTLLVGAIGWGVLAGWALEAPSTSAAHHGPVTFAVFLLVILATRAMAFRIVPDSVLSLDTGFNVAAAAALGPLAAGELVGLALTIDALVRAFRTRQGRGAERFGYVLYFGGLTGALVAVSAWLIGPPTDLHTELEVTWRVLAIGGVLLIVHNAVQGVRQALGGRAVTAFLLRQALPGMIPGAAQWLQESDCDSCPRRHNRHF